MRSRLLKRLAALEAARPSDDPEAIAADWRRSQHDLWVVCGEPGEEFAPGPPPRSRSEWRRWDREDIAAIYGEGSTDGDS